MNRRAIEEEKRLRAAKRSARFCLSEMKRWTAKAWSLRDRVRELEAALQDPEGTIQRGLNERYSRDMREREMAHHAAWDAEVVVHKMAAARWMRGCAAKVADAEGFFAIGAAIERLPLVPEDG